LPDQLTAMLEHSKIETMNQMTSQSQIPATITKRLLAVFYDSFLLIAVLFLAMAVLLLVSGGYQFQAGNPFMTISPDCQFCVFWLVLDPRWSNSWHACLEVAHSTTYRRNDNLAPGRSPIRHSRARLGCTIHRDGIGSRHSTSRSPLAGSAFTATGVADIDCGYRVASG
jgi:hypothetical protein